jgi:hypothetical protein
MTDQRKLKKEYKALVKSFESKVTVNEQQAKHLYHLLKEIQLVEEEIELICNRAFFPYHDVPILELLTNERYHQGTPPGTCPPD